MSISHFVYQPTTGTLFGLPVDSTSVSAPLVVETTDSEFLEIAALTGDWLVVYPEQPGQGSPVPVPPSEETSETERLVGDEHAPPLSEDEDPVLADLWDNPDDERYADP